MAITAHATGQPDSTLTFGLMYVSLQGETPALSFPCDFEGHVDMNALSERAKANYLLARALVGRHYGRPVIVMDAATAKD